MLFQGFTGYGRVMAVGGGSAPRQEKGSGGVSNVGRRSINQASGLSLHTQTHATEESHYRKCGFINNNSISFNEHCRYRIENKSETGDTSPQES